MTLIIMVLLDTNKSSKLKSAILKVFSVIFISAVLLALILIANIFWYKGRAYPGVYLDSYSLGGLTSEEVKSFVENLNNKLSKEGITLNVADSQNQTHFVKLNTILAGDSTVELVRLDTDAIVKTALTAGREGNWLQKLVRPWWYRFGVAKKMLATIIINSSAVADVLRSLLVNYEDVPHDARIIFAPNSASNYTVEIEKLGRSFAYDKIINQIKNNLSVLNFLPILIKTEPFLPTVTKIDVEKLTSSLPKIFSYGKLGLNYVDPQTNLRRDWAIAPAQFAPWLIIKRGSDNNFIFSLSFSRVKNYLNSEVRPYVDLSAADAKFVMVNDRVKEFTGSRSGRKMNADKIIAELAQIFEERNFNPARPLKTVTVNVDFIEPQIKTADVNNLGITDVIGVGVSTFKGSHVNRIKNIATAVKKLNGILIKPGEEFSANKYAGPYTSEAGYLPELVIKGREIKPEIGGGLCQIGTTLFRMAMNSGMPITARRNHSLVVNYYADPVNGNPGTDATLYGDVVDFKFLNDTGNYLLLQAEADYKTQQLVFTLWGKSDGRKGWYSHPKVSKWIPAGDPEEVQISDGTLKVGETKCQDAYKGAVASFTYSRLTPLGKQIDKVYESFYRPLPKICMVGVAASSTPTGAQSVDKVIESVQ